jgi:NADH-quinone oxidoreductase subunit G
MRAQKKVLIIGSDVFAHARAANIAKLAALIEKYTDYSLLVIPREVNTVGASLICDLDSDEDLGNVVGYNARGEFIITASDDADLTTPAFNQQEGTVVSIDNRLLPLNAALGFDGYELNDIANALGIEKEYTIEYTKELPQEKGFKAVEFDALENFLDAFGEDTRGYLLDEIACDADGSVEEIAELPEYNGTITYDVDPVLQFNKFTAKTKQLQEEAVLSGSAQFAAAAKISDGDVVEITTGSETIQRTFRLDSELKGTIALNPTFDRDVDASQYRFHKSKIVRVM